MNKTILFISLIFAIIQTSFSQTIVKMNLPQQANEALKVVVLFDEEVPGGMTVVLGLMGYQINGGKAPYTFQWYQNGNLIGSEDVVSLVPANGDQLTLKITDKNRCFSQSSVKMKVKSVLEKDKEDLSGGIKIYPTLISDNQIQIMLPKLEVNETALVRIIDMSGKVKISNSISESKRVNLELPSGSYFVYVMTNQFHKVEKIVVQ